MDVPEHLSTVLRTIVEHATRLVGAPMGGLYLVEPDGQALRLVVSYNLPQDYTNTLLPLGAGLSGRVAQSGETLIVDDYSTWSGRAEVFSGSPFTYVVGVPLKINGQVIGVLNITDVVPRPPYDARQIELINLFASQAAITLQNAQLLEAARDELALRQHTESIALAAERRTAALYRISEAAQSAGTLQELFGLLHTIIAGLMPARNFYIALYDSATDLISYPYYVDEYDAPPPTARPVRGLTEYVLRQGEPLLVTPELFRQLVASGAVEAIGADSIDWLGVPLKMRPIASSPQAQDTIGIMAVQSYDPAERYTQADQEVLAFVSAQAAMAIERKRNEEALNQAAARYRMLFEKAPLGILLFTPQGDILEVNPAVCQILGSPSEAATKAINVLTFPPLVEAGFAANALKCLETGQTIEAEVTYTSKWGKSAQVHYYLSPVADLIQAILEDVTPRRQAEQEVQHLNAELLAETQRRAEQLNLLYDAGLVLNQTLDPREQVEALSRIAMQALHADHSGFFRYDAARDEISYEFGVGRGADQAGFTQLHRQRGEAHGLIGWIVEQGTPFYLPDVSRDPRWIPIDPEIRSVYWVPIELDGRLLGLLSVASVKLDAFSPEDQWLLRLFANQVAVAMDKVRLYQEAVHAAERRTTLHWLSQEIIRERLAPERIYELLYQATLKLMPAEAFIIALQLQEYAGGKDMPDASCPIRLVYCMDLGVRYPGPEVPAGQGLSGYVIRTGQSQILDESALAEQGILPVHVGTAHPVRSILAVPMRLGERVLGMLSAQCYWRNAYTPEDAALLEILAATAAIALENASIFSRMQAAHLELTQAYEATIEGWSRALEMRDKETKGHSVRVSQATLRLAAELGFSPQALDHLRRGVLLHDIGKMAIPDHILLKPGPLSEDEWQVMRQHPLFAYRMLSGIPFLEPALEVPYCHHENWDGTGYPRGLKGPEIPLSARVFAIVDVWDALSRDRPYRLAWTPEAVRAYLVRQAGLRFDPDLVPVFLRLLDAGEFAFDM